MENQLNIEMEKGLEQNEIDKCLNKIKNKIFVFSGKGGVGKSTVAVNMAASLAKDNYRVGLLDIDIHGPSIPKLLNIEKHSISTINGAMQPIQISENLKVISIGFLLEDSSTAIIWRGPRKIGLIKQFLKDVNWGELDYLIVDSPPGTGDEPLTICQLIPNANGAVIVTTPQDLAIIDVQKAVTFCNQLNIKVIGVIENMSGFMCPHCGNEIDIFKSGGGAKMAQNMSVPFLGKIPINADIVTSCDEGSPVVYKSDSMLAKTFKNIVDSIM